jgi:hypothetical protein
MHLHSSNTQHIQRKELARPKCNIRVTRQILLVCVATLVVTTVLCSLHNTTDKPGALYSLHLQKSALMQ